MCYRDKVSVIVPSMSALFLKNLLSNLSKQTVKPYEVVIVFKGDDSRHVEKICTQSTLNCNIIEQHEGYFTRALNLGKKNVNGDIVIFTDEDAIPNPRWVETYLKLHRSYHNVGCICSRDKYSNIKGKNLKRTPDDNFHVRLYRWLVRPWLERPHPLLKRYRFGVYLTKTLRVAYGPFIPTRSCYSLAFRGVNMSFKKEALEEVEFPEHPLLKIAPGNEQYVSLQLILKGWESIYVPNNPVLHIVRESLSRTTSKLNSEKEIMKTLYAKMIGREER